MASPGVPVACVSDIVSGTTRRVMVNDVAVRLCNVGGQIYAIEDVCTHDGSPLDQGELDGAVITCPRQGAMFDVTTGAVLALPAIMPIRTFPVRVEREDIYLRV